MTTLLRSVDSQQPHPATLQFLPSWHDWARADQGEEEGAGGVVTGCRGGPAGINIVYTEPLHQLVLDITADKMKVSYQ